MKKIPIRIPVPKPTRPHGTPKGKRGYARTENRRLIEAAKKGD